MIELVYEICNFTYVYIFRPSYDIVQTLRRIINRKLGLSIVIITLDKVQSTFMLVLDKGINRPNYLTPVGPIPPLVH